MTNFIATSGNDSLAGTSAAGDVADYHTLQGTSGVQIDLNVLAAQPTFGSGADSLTGIDDVIGTDFIDVLTGNAGDNNLYGNGGSDELDGGAGGNDRLEGGDGDDTLSVAYSGAGHAGLYGGAGYDTFHIALASAASSAIADGGEGNDRFTIDAAGAVTLTLGAGQDTVSLAATQTGLITITDFQTGDQGDALDLEAWMAAALPAWTGSESPFGTLVRLSYANGSTTVQIKTDSGWQDAIVLQDVHASDLTAHNLGGFSPDGSATPGEIRAQTWLAGGTVGDDVLIGTWDDDQLSGGAGNDTIDSGYSGYDVLAGGSGADSFIISPATGGVYTKTITDFQPGVDTLHVRGATAVKTHFLVDGVLNVRFDDDQTVALVGVTWSDDLAASFTYEPLPTRTVGVSVENDYYRDTKLFVNTGTWSGDDAFMVRDDWRSGGADVGAPIASTENIDNQATGMIDGDITLKKGDDSLTNAGHITGTIDMGLDNDSVVNTGTITGDIELADGDDSYDGTAGTHDNGTVHGGLGNDTLNAGDGSQYLFGDSGDDVISGGAGDDWIDGGPGMDILDGGDGYDTLSYRSSLAGISVDLAVGEVETAAGTGTISGFEAVIGSAFDDIVFGSSAADRLQGEKGNDTLYGGAGNDLIIGGKGADVLTGEGGNDTFIYNSGDGQDIVTDFKSGRDVLSLGGITAYQMSQDGADTLLAFADGGSIRLMNVAMTTLKPQDIVLGDDTSAQWAADPGTRVLDGTNIYFHSDFTVHAGETYTFSDQRYGFVVAGRPTAHSAGTQAVSGILYNAGTIAMQSHGAAAAVSMDESLTFSDFGASFINEATGVVLVQGTFDDSLHPFNQRVAGVETMNCRMDIDNEGLIKVSAAGGWAYGVNAQALFGGMLNNGRIEVLNTGGSALGIAAFTPQILVNSGSIIVEGKDHVIGISINSDGYFSIPYITNSGLIMASAEPGSAYHAIGVNVGAGGVVDNSGTIIAEIAVNSERGNGSGALLTLNNTGTIIGDIQLSYSEYETGFDNWILNNGSITGDIHGGQGKDQFDAGTGTMIGTIYGNDGNDYLFAGDKGEIFDGGGGFDTVDFSLMTKGVKVAISGTTAVAGFGIHTFVGIEALIGSHFNDTLIGGAGDDVFDGGGGADIFVIGRGGGRDRINDFTAGDRIDVSGDNGYSAFVVEQRGANTLLRFTSTDSLVLRDTDATTLTTANFIFAPGVSAIIGSNKAETETGAGGNDMISGLGGNDTLYGGDGNDTLDGGAGTDSMSGGNGNDKYYVDNKADIVIEQSGGGSDVVFSATAYTLGAFVEKLTLLDAGNISGTGNSLNNTLIGNDGNNKLIGGEGNDTLGGGLGNDTLDGGKGMDSMKGGAGDDRYYIDNKLDTVTEYTGQGVDTIVINGTYTLGLNVENLTLSGSSDRFGTGNALDNHLTGNVGNNTLGGAAGNDVIDGGKGADTMRGGTGDDSFYVDNLGDTVTEYSNQGKDSVFSAVSFTLGNNVENLTLTGSANINATGNDLINIMYGNAGNNILNGGAGNDGLQGGAGADTFVFGLGSGLDQIGDFNVSEGDMIDLSAYHLKHHTITQWYSMALIDLGGGNQLYINNYYANDAGLKSHIIW